MRHAAVYFAAVGLLTAACDDEPEAAAPPAAPPAAASAQEPPGPVETHACRPSNAAASFTLGPPPAAASADDDPIALPNAVELGEAVPMPFGFAVTALAESGGETHAQLALLGDAADQGRVVDLGRVHGMVTPPRVAAVEGGALVAVPDGDVSGVTLRMARVEGDLSASRVSWGARVPQGDDESPVFALGVSGEHALVAWDAWDGEGDHGVVRTQALSTAGVSTTEASVSVSGPEEDAEGPRLVSRPGGFWIGWIVNAAVADEQKRHVAEDIAPGVALGPRWIRIARLDGLGRPSGSAVSVSAEDGRVLGFDVVSLGDAVLVAWRDDATSPATPGGRILAARVAADGSVDSAVVATDDVGAGEPLLFGGPGADRPRWLAFAAENDSPRLAPVQPDGTVGPAMREAGLERGMPLLATTEGLLSAVMLGRSVELSLLRCDRPKTP